MEQRQDHIATLCAVATVGIAFTGFALGTVDTDRLLVNPGKRKAPGSDAPPRPATTSDLPIVPRRSFSQPAISTLPLDTHTHDLAPNKSSSSLFRRRTVREVDQNSNRESQGTQSRGSSHSRLSSFHRPWTANRDLSAERHESRPSSSWLKRISTMTSLTSSSITSSTSLLDTIPATSTSQTYTKTTEKPNKLVKRSSTRRIASAGGPQPSAPRRPSNHQRSTTIADIHIHSAQMIQPGPESPRQVMSSPTWKPFFDNTPARKRHTSSAASETTLRTISATFGQKPTLLLGSQVHTTELLPDQSGHSMKDTHPSPPNVRQRLRRSLGSVHRGTKQRNFTEPIVKLNRQEARGSIISSHKDSPISTLSNVSTFDIKFSHGTPSFTSSPPLAPSTPARFTIHKRISIAPSDPTTASSDNDARVFTDDDSMDFNSDTAYDSLATRVTNNSNAAIRRSRVDTIFDDLPEKLDDNDDDRLERMMKNTRIDDEDLHMADENVDQPGSNVVGFGIDGLDRISEASPTKTGTESTTPKRTPPTQPEDVMATPVPHKGRTRIVEFSSSPPFMLQGNYPGLIGSTRMIYPEEMEIDDDKQESDDENLTDWSPKLPEHNYTLAGQTKANNLQDSLSTKVDNGTDPGSDRPSAFDWSEPVSFGSELSNGISPRPLTGHGRYGKNLGRSRPSGRKAGGVMHLRSQSVPVNRDSLADASGLPSTAKFGTWNLGLGHKHVEEWSDDFEFDEPEEVEVVSVNVKSAPRDSMRSVKIPQNIIDRQASVHIQFGQVQEFMLLVEELKRLRGRGLALQVLDRSRQLWDDAESIINLATIDEEPDVLVRPPSPTSSDIFGDDTTPSKPVFGEATLRSPESTQHTPIHRTVSSSTASPSGRPRSESLAQAKNFLQTIHQSSINAAVSSAPKDMQQQEKLPFDTPDLRNLVLKAGAITKALKEIVRKAEGVSVSPVKTPTKNGEPSFRQIFDPPNTSPSPLNHRPGLPNSRSANSYLGGLGSMRTGEDELSSNFKFASVVEAN